MNALDTIVSHCPAVASKNVNSVLIKSVGLVVDPGGVPALAPKSTPV